MEWTILSQVKTTLQNNLNAALTYIGNKYSITFETIPDHKFRMVESEVLDSCPAVYIFSPSEDMLGDSPIWGMDQGDMWQWTIYIDAFVEDDDPENCYQRAILYKRAIRKVFKENIKLGSDLIQGCIITGTRNGNLFSLNQNLNMGVRVILNVVAFEFDYFPMES